MSTDTEGPPSCQALLDFTNPGDVKPHHSPVREGGVVPILQMRKLRCVGVNNFPKRAQ